VTRFADEVAAVRAGAAPEKAAAWLLSELPQEERLGLLDGDQPFWPGMPEMMGIGYNLEPIVAGAVDRLGIPGIRFADGPRGAVVGQSTAFPVPMARGATWDPALEERVGDVIGAEIRAQGGNFFGGVCINLLRHPAWGRAQETYGEEPLLLGAMGSALTRGSQRHVMACVKHYACNSMENARFTVDVRVDDDVLHEVYLPHFRAVVDAGVASVMSAYNSVNGEWCGQSRPLLTDVLRDEWGFRGMVISDFIWGLRDPVGSLVAGLDVEMPFAQQRAGALPAALAEGRASWDDVDRSALRVLATQLRFAAALPDEAPPASVVLAPEHRALAREVATRSMVLLQNAPVDGRPLLPLDRASLRRVAVVGRLADVANTGDHGSSDVRAPEVVTPLAGLQAALSDADVLHVEPDNPAVAEADVALVVVGYTAQDEGEYVGSFDPDLAVLYPPSDDPAALGELARVWDAGPQMVGGDRDSLRLHAADVATVRAVAAANPRVVVAVVAGSAVVMEEWRHDVPGVLLIWYAGMEGGHALADVLLGAAEPSGRLPFAVPTDERHLPGFDKDAPVATYDRWHGQRLLDRDGVAAAFPLGAGLGWTTYAWSDASAEARDGLEVRVTVTNTGDRPGTHLTLVFASRDTDAGRERLLLGFARDTLAPGESRDLHLRPDLAPLLLREGPGRWAVQPGPWQIEVGPHAGDAAAVGVVSLG
jgi:beta-glucosidase